MLLLTVSHLSPIYAHSTNIPTSLLSIFLHYNQLVRKIYLGNYALNIFFSHMIWPLLHFFVKSIGEKFPLKTSLNKKGLTILSKEWALADHNAIISCLALFGSFVWISWKFL